MNACAETRERVEEFAVDLTTPVERRAIEQHLGECEACRATFHRVRRIEETLMSAGGVPPAVVEAGLSRLRVAVERERRGRDVISRRSVMPLIAAASLMTGIFVWVLAPRVQDAGPAKQEPSFDERKLVTLPEGVGEYEVAPDGRTVAFVVTRDGKKRVVVGDTVRGPYEDVGSLSFTPAGVITYDASVAAAGGAERSVYVFGKQEIDPYPHLLAVSEDGARAAWAVVRDGTWSVTAGEKQYGPYDEVADLTVTRDGGRVAFGARIGERWSVFVDGKAGPDYEAVRTVRWAPDGSRVAYVGRVSHEQGMVKRGEERTFVKSEKVVVVVGDVVSDPFDHVGAPVFRPDGAEVAYRAGIGGGWFVVSGGKRGDEYDFVGDPRYSPDGKQLIHSARLEAAWYVVVGGKTTSVPDGIREIAFGGGRVAVVAGREDGPGPMQVVEQEAGSGAKYDSIGGLRFARFRDEHVTVYCARQGAWHHVVYDQIAGPRYREVGLPAVSPNGRFIAYPAMRSGKWVLVTGAVEHNESENRPLVASRNSEDFDDVGSPVFSADSRKVAFPARKGRELIWKVIALE